MWLVLRCIFTCTWTIYLNQHNIYRFRYSFAYTPMEKSSVLRMTFDKSLNALPSNFRAWIWWVKWKVCGERNCVILRSVDLIWRDIGIVLSANWPLLYTHSLERNWEREWKRPRFTTLPESSQSQTQQKPSEPIFDVQLFKWALSPDFIQRSTSYSIRYRWQSFQKKNFSFDYLSVIHTNRTRAKKKNQKSF